MIRIAGAFVVFILIGSLTAQQVFAAKARVRKGAPSVARGGTTSGSYSSAKLSRSTNSVIISFFNLGNLSKISYTLSYSANGISQGVGGSITPSGATDSRDLYFGTCSHGACTPHRNIKNAKLIVTTTLKSGGIHTKRYTIKY